MAPRLTPPRGTDVMNRLCQRCRRSCKQQESAIITTCPRYYPIRTKQAIIKEWKQQELFND